MRSPSIAAHTSLAPELASRARALRRAHGDGAPLKLLKARNIGVLYDAAGQGEAALVQRAALDLGAQVSLVQPGLTDLAAAQSLTPTARMLGRLYDAIVCIALPAALVDGLADASGVPVLAGLDEPAGPETDERLFVWQARLLDCLG